MSCFIKGTAYCVPDGKLGHAELSERFGHETMDKIAKSSGIYERRVCLDGECASDLAHRAATDLIEALEIDVSKIELLVFATQTPDYLLPTTACLLQDRLGVPTSAAAFDVNLGCSQYVYSLAVAHGMIESGTASNALVLTGDTVSRILHPEDRAVVPLFGDAGTATYLESSDGDAGFKGFELGSDGSGSKHLIWPASGLRQPHSAETAITHEDKGGSIRSADDMFMDGAAIFIFTIKTVPALVKGLLAKAQMSLDDIDLFIFHQASELIVETAAKKLKVPREKIHYKLHDVGNSGGSTVCIALTDAWLAGRVRPGMKIMLAAFGVGLSWAGTIIEWSEDSAAVCNVDFSDSPPRPPRQTVA